VWLGAHLSARAPGGLVRRALGFVLLASALKLLDVSTTVTGIILGAVLIFAPFLWMMVRPSRFSGAGVARRPVRVTEPPPACPPARAGCTKSFSLSGLRMVAMTSVGPY
jgi:hypothetical protein